MTIMNKCAAWLDAGDLIARHNRMTAENEHGIALQILAAYLGMEETQECQRINIEQDKAGHLTPELEKRRKQVYKRVHAYARKIMGNRYAELN